MPRNRRTIALLAAAGLTLAGAACADGDGTGPTGPLAPGEQGETDEGPGAATDDRGRDDLSGGDTGTGAPQGGAGEQEPGPRGPGGASQDEVPGAGGAQGNTTEEDQTGAFHGGRP